MRLDGKRIAVLVDELYEDLELWYPVLRLREAGARADILGTGKAEYGSKYGYPAPVDGNVADANAADYDGVIIPGGFAPDKMRRVDHLLEFVRQIDAAGKLVAFICHGGWVPISAGIVKGRRVTSVDAIRDDLVNAGAEWWDEAVVRDGHMITSRRPPDLPDFAAEILAVLSEGAQPQGERA